MRLDAVTAEIRPRSDWEAVDLGLAMVRRDFWRCLMVWWLAMAVLSLVGGVLLWSHPLVLLVLFWWCKPAGSRMVLFELSRRLFGEQPTWAAVGRELPRAWTRRFGYRFLWTRFSPWLPVTLAVEDLEGLRGQAYKRRCAQLAGRGEGALMWIYLIADIAAVWFGVAILAFVLMLLPDGLNGEWFSALESWDPDFPMEIPLVISRMVTVCVMLSMSLTDVFVTGAGFGIYLNNRTWLEGWDVELAFKRLARRLAKTVMIVAWFFLLGFSSDASGEARRSPAEVIREVKSDEAFEVHTVVERVPVKKPAATASEWVGSLVIVVVLAALAWLVGMILWRCLRSRHLLKLRFPKDVRREGPQLARVVMGMEVSPDTLPSDIPEVAWALWQQGRHQESLGLLYRGSISRVIEIGNVAILESDTEGDCLARVAAAGNGAYPEYFRRITQRWIGVAYAGEAPADFEMRALCDHWPFGERSRL